MRAVRRAALLHDLGRASVSNGIWDKPNRLTTAEWERVRLHPYYTERVLERAPALAPLARLAGGLKGGKTRSNSTSAVLGALLS